MCQVLEVTLVKLHGSMIHAVNKGLESVGKGSPSLGQDIREKVTSKKKTEGERVTHVRTALQVGFVLLYP